MISVLRDEIVPDLIERVPNQPTQEELSDRPYISRFMLVFDREGFSPDFIKEMWELRIACCTYKKHVKDIWALEEFTVVKVTLSNKETTKMICYRAETCLTSIVRECIAHKDEARNLVRVILKSDIDLEVDKENNVLKVSLHNLSSRSMDQAVQKLCDKLNRTDIYFTGTNLRLFYKLVTSKYP